MVGWSIDWAEKLQAFLSFSRHQKLHSGLHIPFLTRLSPIISLLFPSSLYFLFPFPPLPNPSLLFLSLFPPSLVLPFLPK